SLPSELYPGATPRRFLSGIEQPFPDRILQRRLHTKIGYRVDRSGQEGDPTGANAPREAGVDRCEAHERLLPFPVLPISRVPGKRNPVGREIAHNELPYWVYILYAKRFYQQQKISEHNGDDSRFEGHQSGSREPTGWKDRRPHQQWTLP